ncbi:ferric-chelate reductase, partial [Genlisea aurea]
VLAAGYFSLFVMMPISQYFHVWIPKLRSHTSSTYFGTTQGSAYFLLYTVPVLLISLLGCFYLHLGKNKGTTAGRRRRWETWRRPIVVMRGLGIVSRIELSLLIMFIALLGWNLGRFLATDFRNITIAPNSHTHHRWQARLERAAVRLGLVGNISLTFLFFPVTRGSSVLRIFGLTSESSIRYHMWLGHIAMGLFTAHGFCYILYWAVTHQSSEIVRWSKTGVSNIAGEISLAAGLGLWAATVPGFRRRFFNVFFYSHHLYILFVVFFVFHLGITFATIMLPGFYLFVVDRYVRFLQSRRRLGILCARVLPCDTVELTVAKTRTLDYAPTSILFLNIPMISKLQWHPFTISSSSNLEADKLSIAVKAEGFWTKKLYELVSSHPSIDRLQVSIEGPYGPTSTPFLRHDILVMISGGSGITPFISIIRELIHKSQNPQQRIPQVLLICAFKNSSDLTMLDLILPVSNSGFSNLQLKIEAFVTREKHPAQDPKAIRTVWFNPDSSDEPMSPVLGQNSWLWLAAIISASFVVYLIFIGILTRFYIYPIDHNSNNVYPLGWRSLFHMSFICICIVIASTAAFLWTKSSNAQIQHTQGLTPQISPVSRSYNAAAIELESLTLQSLSQSVNVHHGERPDLRKILLEHKEQNTGVLVSGPQKLRHEVAKICSSRLAANLHFESISFSW